jgi:hypothetical protein
MDEVFPVETEFRGHVPDRLQPMAPGNVDVTFGHCRLPLDAEPDIALGVSAPLRA